MYVVNIEGAPRGTYQRVKKILKDHGIYAPNNCVYEDKTFRFAWPTGADFTPVSGAIEDLGLSVGGTGDDDTDEFSLDEDTSDRDVVDPDPKEAERIDAMEDRIHRLMLDLPLVARRVDSMDRSLASALQAMAVFFSDVLVVLDSASNEEESEASLERARRLVAAIRAS
jgi:hypothetical protein